MKLRILQVYKDYFPVVGGIENHVKLLATRLIYDYGMDVRVLVTNTGRDTVVSEENGLQVIKAGRFGTVASTPISLSLLKEMGRQEVDLAHLHFPYPMGEMAYLLRGRSKRLILTYHSDIVRQRRLLSLYRPFLWRILHRADRIIASSPNYIRSSPFLQKVEEKCTVIPFGIELKPWEKVDLEEVQGLRQRYEPPLLLFVGRFRYYKGLTYLLEAMKGIEATLLLVGSGPLEGELKHQVVRDHLQTKVFSLGELADEKLPALYHASDLFILPACERAEAFGIAQVEAMACGLPLVSTELGTGTTYVNTNEETGIVVPPRDPGALAMAVNFLLENESLRRQMGEKAKERARREFDADLMVRRIVQLYQNVCELG